MIQLDEFFKQEETCARPLQRIARRLIRGREDAEDVYVESRYQAYRRQSQLRVADAYYHWSCQILRRVAYSHLKREQKRTLIIQYTSLEVLQEQEERLARIAPYVKLASHFPPDFQQLADEEADPLSHVMKGFVRDCLWKAINALSEDDRRLIRAAYLEEQEREAIAEAENLSSNHLKVKLHRIRKRLAHQMRLLLAEDEDT